MSPGLEGPGQGAVPRSLAPQGREREPARRSLWLSPRWPLGARLAHSPPARQWHRCSLRRAGRPRCGRALRGRWRLRTSGRGIFPWPHASCGEVKWGEREEAKEAVGSCGWHSQGLWAAVGQAAIAHPGARAANTVPLRSGAPESEALVKVPRPEIPPAAISFTTHGHPRARTHAHACTPVHNHTCIHTCMCMYMLCLPHACTHRHIHAQLYIHKNTPRV